MKTKKFFLIGIFVIMVSLLGIIACNETEEKENDVSKKSKFEKMDTFFDAKIATLHEDKVEVIVAKDDILVYAKEALKDTKLNLKPYDCKIIQENGIKYLRIYSDRNYVSTVELIENNSTLKVGKTVCTSTACATGGGCIPNGEYCTSCTPPNSPGLPGSGDCTRTTTGG